MTSSNPQPVAGNDEPETFEYREVNVRRIHRGAFSSGGAKPASPYAWRARVDVRSKGTSVTAGSVAEMKVKIDAILDAGK